MKIVKNIIFILFGLAFIFFGTAKFIKIIPVPEFTDAQMAINEALMKLKWITPLVGSMEIIGGLLIVFPKTRALGAIILLPILIGIILHHSTLDPSGTPMALVLGLIDVWIIADHWKKYLPMIK
ncbi:DoxX family protein [Sphingobacterium endophyticum]|uniref:DoxX family protein n=1 Tax=Sphingobacterium endophyticum TaxID=2546448 RepID=UPI0012E1A317|nr:DoxX family protein [Sphingobacterium endophyticum]